MSRWLVFAPAAILAFSSSIVKAEPVNGLNAVGYQFVPTAIPTRSDVLYPICGSELENNINRNFNGEPFQACGADFFMVHYTGFITVPEHQSIQFMVAADDGGTVNIGGYEFGTWNLKGCSWSSPISPVLSEGRYALDGWFFEWAGGTCFMLAWNIDDQGWEIVPEWAFITESMTSTTTTTTTVPETTVPATTTTSTTVQETTTTVEQTTTTETSTTVQETSTTVKQTTTTQTSTTVAATTSTVADTSTTTTTESVPVSESSTTTTTEPATTTTWFQPPPPVTVDTTLPATLPTQSTEVPEATDTTEPSVTVPELLPEEIPQPPTTEGTIQDTPLTGTVSDEIIDPQQPVVETEPNPLSVTIPESAEEAVNGTVAELEAFLSEASPAEVEAVVNAVLSGESSQEQVVALATSSEVLATIDGDQASQLFETLNVTELDNTEIEALVEAVQDAPTEVREAFEKEINIFGEGFNNYVPIGSNIPVAVRRTLVAVTGGMTLVATGTRVKR